MLSESEITEKLKTLGCKSSDIPKVLHEVGLLIGGKALAAYVSKLPDEERKRMLALQPDELQAYLDEKKDALPAFSQEQFAQIHDQMWRDYFAAIE